MCAVGSDKEDGLLNGSPHLILYLFLGDIKQVSVTVEVALRNGIFLIGLHSVDYYCIKL
jgi:sRNA-binding regulator protein Hfq